MPPVSGQTSASAAGARAASIDPREVDKFQRLAAEWWNPDGKFRPLHRFNPARLAALQSRFADHFGRERREARPFAGLSLLDIGCGGGLVAEPLARLGAAVTGIDPAPANIEAARIHAQGGGLAIDYRATTAEALASGGEAYDVVLALEVVEHVADVTAFIATAASLVRPGGLLAVATINRTAKAYALAIVGAEYVLRWLPRGTHDYDKLVRPEELEAALRAAGLDHEERIGIVYNPLAGRWSQSADTDVNYMVFAVRPGA